MRVAAATIAAALFLSLVAVPGGELPAATPPTGRVRLIIGFDDASARDRSRAHDAAGADVVDRVGRIDADVVEVDDADAAAAAYQQRDDVAYVETDGMVRAQGGPNDPSYAAQWNLQPPSAANPSGLGWEPVYTAGAPLGTGVRVAVVDSGFRPGGLDAPAVVNTADDWDFVRGDATADDENGHGTHVAGTIAQSTDNAKGVAGVAPGAEILPVKVLDASGSAPISTAIAGLFHAADKGASVINLSLAGRYSRAFCDAIAAAARTAVVVVAAGNDAAGGGFAPVSWPAGCPGALAVGALDHLGRRTPYSNGGCNLAVAAPGGDLRQRRADGSPYAIRQETFTPSGFALVDQAGTSMAAAHVSGAAAVLLAHAPRPSLAAVAGALRSTARDVGEPGADTSTGAGAVDLQRALAAVSSSTVTPPASPTGYWMAASDGGIFAFGDAPFLGSMGGTPLNSPIVGLAPTPTRRGYWLVAADGGIFAFGDAPFLGSMGGTPLNRPIVAMTPSPSGLGYWLVASDGGVFTFGDAGYFGSMGGLRLNRSIVTMAATPTGLGYWLVASDGGIFAFGDAGYAGSTGGIALNQPITAMAATLSGQGYWLVAADGGIFAFGDAVFRGSTGARVLNSPIVAVAPTCRGEGYWLAAADGGVFSFGDAAYLGSMGATRLTRPVVAAASR